VKIRLCIVTMTPELLYDAVDHAVSRASSPVGLSVYQNFCSVSQSVLREKDKVSDCLVLEQWDLRTETTPPTRLNGGVVPAMTKLWEHAGDADILFYIHDDCRILEQGWDDRIRRRFEQSPNCDAVGLVGGTGIGAEKIYRLDYAPIQLARHNVWSNMTNAEANGRRRTDDMRIATADGCALAVRRSFLDAHGGWSWCPTANHGYDNGLACMLRRHGKEFWLVPLAFEHPSSLKFSGVPANQQAIESYAATYGSDHSNWERAHRWLYDEFRDVLPFHVS